MQVACAGIRLNIVLKFDDSKCLGTGFPVDVGN